MAIARVEPRGLELRKGLLESGALLLGKGRVEHLGFGEMAEDALQLDGRRAGNACGEPGKIGHRNAQAAHAGIDLEVYRNGV